MENDNYKAIYGNSIRNLRLKNNLTQEELSQITGFDTKYISQLENGRYMGTIMTMLKLCKAFNVTPNDILCDFIKDLNGIEAQNKFDSKFSKLSKKDKKNILTLMDSMLSN